MLSPHVLPGAHSLLCSRDVGLLAEIPGISYTISESKLRPCSFDSAAAAKAWFRLAARNASHFGVTSCHAIPFSDKNYRNFYLKMELFRLFRFRIKNDFWSGNGRA
jgi:hypothetical protein